MRKLTMVLLLAVLVGTALAAGGAKPAQSATSTVDSITGAVALREAILRANSNLSHASLPARESANASDGIGSSADQIAAAPAGVLPLDPRDLVSAAGVEFNDNRVLEITPSGQVTRLALENSIVPTGIAVDPARSRVVIASVSRVVIVNVATGAEQVISGFDFIADVAVLPNGDIIAAEQGEDFLGPTVDGSVLRIDAAASVQPIAPAFPWISPTLVDIDQNGHIIVVNEAAGPEILPGSGLFYDSVESIDLGTGQVSTLYDGPGIIGTGLAVESATTLLLASVSSLQRLNITTGTLATNLCPGLSFSFVDGLDVDADGTVVMNDIDFIADSSLFRGVNTQTCTASLIATTEEAGGVAIVKGEAAPGDCTGDGGEPNIVDVLRLLRHIGDPEVPLSCGAGDCTGDGGDANIVDVLRLLRHIGDRAVPLSC